MKPYKGLISSIYGTIAYTISKHNKEWSISFQTWNRSKDIKKDASDKMLLIKGFRLKRDAMAFVDNELESYLFE